MKRARIMFIVSAMVTVMTVAPVPSAQAAVTAEGEFAGEISADCSGGLSNYSCNLEGETFLCTEYLASLIGTECFVSYSGFIDGAGFKESGVAKCSGVGSGDAYITSNVAGSGFRIPILFVVTANTGLAVGVENDGVAPDGSHIAFSFTANCNKDVVGQTTKGD